MAFSGQINNIIVISFLALYLIQVSFSQPMLSVRDTDSTGTTSNTAGSMLKKGGSVLKTVGTEVSTGTEDLLKGVGRGTLAVGGLGVSTINGVSGAASAVTGKLSDAVSSIDNYMSDIPVLRKATSGLSSALKEFANSFKSISDFSRKQRTESVNNLRTMLNSSTSGSSTTAAAA
ncbi:uncharacterized protein LOC126897653 [Daktulosphaira vitifoliae]|uniref:uncharacterized protein LOC126897653 n=1 Tax=Daktulosphaira vitifoliae TaxID=58002 RepID=UPI0021AAB24F|nr:uncharacterized protein LOC126897653 [Daktulosphaira vitifoliae]